MAGDGGRDDVASVLQQHGLSTTAAQAVVRIGAELRSRTERRGNEFAAVIDADSGTRLGSIVEGTFAGVDLSPLVAAMRPRREYLAIHTHPRSSSFSGQDAAILANFPQIRGHAVVGLDGTWYVLRRASGHRVPDAKAVNDRFEAEYAARAPRYAQLVRGRELDSRQSLRELTHEVWQHLAAQLGLRYDRVEES